MKTALHIVAVSLCLLVGVQARAQYVLANPLEWMALAEGNEAINGEIKDETQRQLETAALQNTIAAEYTQIHEWERKYNSYLTTVSGYASSVKAATSLYHDGVATFITLARLKRVVASNPGGIAASMSMNNLYMETAEELVTVFTLLRDAVAVGGKANMLTGAERSETLWQLQDRLHSFSQKLRLLYMSIRYYTVTDVWNTVTAGMIDRSNGAIARQAKQRWKRAALAIHE